MINIERSILYQRILRLQQLEFSNPATTRFSFLKGEMFHLKDRKTAIVDLQDSSSSDSDESDTSTDVYANSTKFNINNSVELNGKDFEGFRPLTIEHLNFAKKHLERRRQLRNNITNGITEMPRDTSENDVHQKLVQSLASIASRVEEVREHLEQHLQSHFKEDINRGPIKRRCFNKSCLCKKFKTYAPRMPNFVFGSRQSGLNSTIYRCEIFENGINWENVGQTIKPHQVPPIQLWCPKWINSKSANKKAYSTLKVVYDFVKTFPDYDAFLSEHGEKSYDAVRTLARAHRRTTPEIVNDATDS
ncbi:hypothetical protein ROZALSC1DRAFT_28150 [Rozella allomycis CSF55]|uniref:Uncharacterized protein n=1 Tax=Rozella allomycis (strain CSF55) TaxID=988480 RepID=A0A075ATN6_ROZAC|nr:hypothetical protein O9G_000416 [Rozella allomycis CSF55]RKP20346.1 hypothetical protein ROZALSC1DRAFT_28150 [Rozella allomycis CSF55]|eukprot:EPZ33641.1 hypothetical protein O9G_000416 [Rozella allomycis CSF55]